jgi:hypothetical protein
LLGMHARSWRPCVAFGAPVWLQLTFSAVFGVAATALGMVLRLPGCQLSVGVLGMRA